MGPTGKFIKIPAEYWPMEQGFQYVLDKIKHITTEPGCYLMKDSQGEVFYIGKAKNLRNRLKSYFFGSDTRIFVQYLEHILFDIEIIVVSNELEALLLERELIRKLKPRFNITLKDDKNYILLKLKRPSPQGRKRDIYPRLEIVRKVKKDKARYFGPYPSANRLRATVDLINKYFMLRTCNDYVLENRTRPCIQYQIERCPAPCVFEVMDYDQEVDNTMVFLNGNFKEIEERLNKKMWTLAENDQFEMAAKVRDQLLAIKTSLTHQAISDINRMRDQDIIGLFRAGPKIMFVQILIRGGTWHRSHNYVISDQPFPKEEVLRSFLTQAYQEGFYESIPQEILIPLPIHGELHGLADELSTKAKRRVHIICPQKGKSRRLLEIAMKNAKTALMEKIEQQNSNEQALMALRDKLGLAIRPHRIECIDISLIQGSEPFGSLVVFIDGKKDPSKYRTYKIRSVSGMNDFAMIKEVVSRRIKEGIERSDLPELLLIDGGKGQLRSAMAAIEEANLLISHSGFYVAGIAKARTIKKDVDEKTVEHSPERLFVPKSSKPIVLDPHTFERYLIERIRDEAHRFALKAHRRSRGARLYKSSLLSIEGIGQKRALKLLRHFKSIEAIKKASTEELMELLHINRAKAQRILELIGQTIDMKG